MKYLILSFTLLFSINSFADYKIKFSNNNFNIPQASSEKLKRELDLGKIEASFLNSYAIKNDGSILAWGDDRYGQVSDAPSGNDFVKISSYERHALALKSNGTIVGWGRDDYGQSTDAPEGDSFVSVSPSGLSSFALTKDGFIENWGGDVYKLLTDAPDEGGSLRFRVEIFMC